MIKILSLNISEKKGTIKVPVDSITLDSKGIVGDAHAGAWHRQVSLLAKESVERFEHKAGREMEHGEFAENITTEGIELATACILDRFHIGEAILEVTQIGKECHGSGCAIFREVGKCVMPKEGIFCRVIKGGEVKTGDEMLYQPYNVNVGIITLSDRAFAGEYTDRSGPQIQECVETFFEDKPWRMKCTITVIPDEVKKLRDEFEKACGECDVVFTTGGTGIGPRDITPDVIRPLLDMEIPGIMDFIRLKYGETIPNALISRSIAGVRNGTLVYCLPGSVKAVTEYANEILRTLEHSIFMIKDIKSH
jgi:molybdopterin adenylyltransferase